MYRYYKVKNMASDFTNVSSLWSLNAQYKLTNTWNACHAINLQQTISMYLYNLVSLGTLGDKI